MTHPCYVFDGIRTPFMRSGNKFANLLAHDLGNAAVNGLMKKINLNPDFIDYVCMGSVIADPDTSNVAREIVLESILKTSTPAHTVTMACISANVAITTLASMIQLGQVSAGIAGGTETFSDLPIRFGRNFRRLMLQIGRKKHFKDRLKLFSSLRLSDFFPHTPSPKEFSTGFSMGQAGDQLAHKFGVSRTEADQFALTSHQRAAKAWEQGMYDDAVVPVDVPPNFITIGQDDGPRPDSSLETLSHLPTAFNEFGINTAANSSFFTDGAAVCLLGDQDFASRSGLSPLATIIDFMYRAGDPLHELLLGPALTVPILLKRNGLHIKDIGVLEIHEAFAGQVLANLKAMASKEFCNKRLGLEEALGEFPMEIINLMGGSLSLGHPFGATGARLILSACKRLWSEGAEYAVVTGCAASGLGSAILLRRADI